MRHKHGYRKLNRTSAHRKALLKNLAIAIIEREKIETTVPKAKELKRFIEKLVTSARNADLNTHRYVFAALQSKEATKKLINEIAPKYEGRNGGYTSIINFLVASLHCKAANTYLCVFKSASLATVTNFSIYLFSSFALGTVVSIFSLSIIAIAIFFNNAFL